MENKNTVQPPTAEQVKKLRALREEHHKDANKTAAVSVLMYLGSILFPPLILLPAAGALIIPPKLRKKLIEDSKAVWPEYVYKDYVGDDGY